MPFEDADAAVAEIERYAGDPRFVQVLLLSRNISGVPVTDAQGTLLGIVTEGDLIRRSELGTERKRGGWLAFFTATALGTDAIAQNFPDYSLNSASNAISRGNIVLLYGTGLGNLAYPLATGQPGVVPPSSYSSKYSCSFGGQTASAYAYWNYGFVGEATWTVTVPSSSPTGAVALTCTDSASGATTQQGVIYVK